MHLKPNTHNRKVAFTKEPIDLQYKHTYENDVWVTYKNILISTTMRDYGYAKSRTYQYLGIDAPFNAWGPARHPPDIAMETAHHLWKSVYRLSEDPMWPCLVTPMCGPRRWLMDTGSGHDLISTQDSTNLSKSENGTPLTLCTAAGKIKVRQIAKVMIDSFKHTATPYVLPNTPAVLSIGRRCMLEGFAFHWPQWSTPYIICPNGTRIDLEVTHFVPYLTEEAAYSQYKGDALSHWQQSKRYTQKQHDQLHYSTSDFNKENQHPTHNTDASPFQTSTAQPSCGTITYMHDHYQIPSPPNQYHSTQHHLPKLPHIHNEIHFNTSLIRKTLYKQTPQYLCYQYTENLIQSTKPRLRIRGNNPYACHNECKDCTPTEACEPCCPNLLDEPTDSQVYEEMIAALNELDPQSGSTTTEPTTPLQQQADLIDKTLAAKEKKKKLRDAQKARAEKKKNKQPRKPRHDGEQQATPKAAISNKPDVPRKVQSQPTKAILEYQTKLKKDATSMVHLMTHRPKNPYCLICQRAKAQRVACKRKKNAVNKQGATMLGETPPCFGDHITGDHFDAKSWKNRGTTGDKWAALLMDRATKWIGVYPAYSKSANESIEAMHHFVSATDTVGTFYSDNSGELAAACKHLNWRHRNALEGKPETNSVAERAVRTVKEGVRCILSQAGLPPSFWPEACRYFCHAFNICGPDGTSPWELRHNNGPFNGHVLPFGARVHFMPNVTRDERLAFDPAMQTGLFLGWEIQAGGVWDKSYHVVPLETFRSFDYHNPPTFKPHRTREIQIPAGPPVFPCYRTSEARTMFIYDSDDPAPECPSLSYDQNQQPNPVIEEMGPRPQPYQPDHTSPIPIVLHEPIPIADDPVSALLSSIPTPSCTTQAGTTTAPTILTAQQKAAAIEEWNKWEIAKRKRQRVRTPPPPRRRITDLTDVTNPGAAPLSTFIKDTTTTATKTSSDPLPPPQIGGSPTNDEPVTLKTGGSLTHSPPHTLQTGGSSSTLPPQKQHKKSSKPQTFYNNARDPLRRGSSHPNHAPNQPHTPHPPQTGGSITPSEHKTPNNDEADPPQAGSPHITKPLIQPNTPTSATTNNNPINPLLLNIDGKTYTKPLRPSMTATEDNIEFPEIPDFPTYPEPTSAPTTLGPKQIQINHPDNNTPDNDSNNNDELAEPDPEPFPLMPSDPQRTIIEYCCSNESLIGSTATPNCNVIRLTQDHDMTSEKGLLHALDLANEAGQHTLLWCAIPCTGGCPWQEVNMRKIPNFENKLAIHKEKFHKLWNNFEILARTVIANGGKIAIEWPTSCAYWSYHTVQRFIKNINLDSVTLHGCALGLTTSRQPKSGKPALPINKPWTIKTNDSWITSIFQNCKCPGHKVHPTHARCKGRDAKLSESYTPEMVARIHVAWADSTRSRVPGYRQWTRAVAQSVQQKLDLQYAALAATEAESDDFIPHMPRMSNPSPLEHRHRNQSQTHPYTLFENHFDCAVAVQLDRKDIPNIPEAQAVMDEEWNKLLHREQVWDQSVVFEEDDLREQAKREKRTYHFGSIFEICSLKGSELPPGTPGRKYKGRAVFKGNDVYDQNFDPAIFAELACVPATMAAAKMVDMFGLIPGNILQQCDAMSAYTQSLLGGQTPTFVQLPRNRWPQAWVDKGMRKPCCPLRKALYGHPDAGGYWERHCETQLVKVGFTPIKDWRSCYWHKDLKCFLVVYVDDFKMAGPADNVSKAWALIRKNIKTDKPTDPSQYLGCDHKITRELLRPDMGLIHGTCATPLPVQTKEMKRKAYWDEQDKIRTTIDNLTAQMTKLSTTDKTTNTSDSEIDEISDKIKNLKLNAHTAMAAITDDTPAVKQFLDTIDAFMGPTHKDTSTDRTYEPAPEPKGPPESPVEKWVTVMTYDMKSYLISCIDRYLELCGSRVPKLRKVETPFLDEVAYWRTNHMGKDGDSNTSEDYDPGQPCAPTPPCDCIFHDCCHEDHGTYHPLNYTQKTQQQIEASITTMPTEKQPDKPTSQDEWRDRPPKYYTLNMPNDTERPCALSPEVPYETKRQRPKTGRALKMAAKAKLRHEKKVKRDDILKKQANTPLPNGEPRGVLGNEAAKVLMKVLYAARMARPDLLRATGVLASNITKWSKTHDKMLHRLMCYIKSSLDLKMIGWVGDDAADVWLSLYSDADFAGSADHTKSTSGVWFRATGPYTSYPLSAISKKQQATSHSTPEAEIVAAALALRSEGLPALQLWETILERRVHLAFLEDNQTALRIMQTGKSNALRHLTRTHNISINWLHERHNDKEYVGTYCLTTEQSADTFTKVFPTADKWEHACKLINHVVPERFWGHQNYKPDTKPIDSEYPDVAQPPKVTAATKPKPKPRPKSKTKPKSQNTSHTQNAPLGAVSGSSP